MLDNLRISGKLALLGAALFAAMTAIGAYGIHALSEARARHAASLQGARQLVHATDAARSAEVNFRMQVQEFKNILLRGQDPKDYQRHFDGFKARNEAVGRQFAEASAEMVKLGVPVGPLQEAQALHREVTRQYLDALQLYEAGKPESAQRADAGVRGKDRPLEQRFAAVIGGLEKYAQESHASTDGIAASSRRISDIIAVIDGIAFQTNILALNAAVEAARAGDQGRGFAVVAGEVRNLAQRSAAAAKEIKALITESVEQVEAGTHMVGNAGQTMAEIVASVKKVSDLIAEIAAASQEQSAGLEQVNTAMSQMDHVVQQNASLVEEAAAATEAMKAQASTLLDVVSRFRLRSLAVQPAPAQPARKEVRPPPALAGTPKLRARPALAAARAPEPRAQGQWEEF